MLLVTSTVDSVTVAINGGDAVRVVVSVAGQDSPPATIAVR